MDSNKQDRRHIERRRFLLGAGASFGGLGAVSSTGLASTASETELEAALAELKSKHEQLVEAVERIPPAFKNDQSGRGPPAHAPAFKGILDRCTDAADEFRQTAEELTSEGYFIDLVHDTEFEELMGFWTELRIENAYIWIDTELHDIPYDLDEIDHKFEFELPALAYWIAETVGENPELSDIDKLRLISLILENADDTESLSNDLWIPGYFTPWAVVRDSGLSSDPVSEGLVTTAGECMGGWIIANDLNYKVKDIIDVTGAVGSTIIFIEKVVQPETPEFTIDFYNHGIYEMNAERILLDDIEVWNGSHTVQPYEENTLDIADISSKISHGNIPNVLVTIEFENDMDVHYNNTVILPKGDGYATTSPDLVGYRARLRLR